MKKHHNARRRTIAHLEVSTHGGGALRAPAPEMAHLAMVSGSTIVATPDKGAPIVQYTPSVMTWADDSPRQPAFRRFLAWLAKLEW